MIHIYARNIHEARDYAQLNKIGFRDWKYSKDPDTLQGLIAGTVIVLDRRSTPEYHRYIEMAKSRGMTILYE